MSRRSLWGVEMNYSNREPLHCTNFCYTKVSPILISLLSQPCQEAQSSQVSVIPTNYVRIGHSIATKAKRVRHHYCDSKRASRSTFIWFASLIPYWRARAFVWRLSLWRNIHYLGLQISCLRQFFSHWGGGAGVLLYAPDGSDVSPSFKLEFPCSNKGIPRFVCKNILGSLNNLMRSLHLRIWL